jgi:xanthine dehydrogenase YagS FAD-binding subunit
MKALTNINARSIAEAVAAASEAAAAGREFAFSGGGTDLLQQIKDGTNKTDVIINLRTVRDARAVSVSTTETLIGGLITLTELAGHTALSDQWAVLREAAASVGTPQIRNVATLAGNVTQRPWCWYYRNGFSCFKAGGNQCFSVNGENQQHAIFGGGPSFIVHPSDLAPALVALNAAFEVTGPGRQRRLAAADFFGSSPAYACLRQLLVWLAPI